MKVKILCNLKNTKAGGLISSGTVYEGNEETLPAFVLSELKLNRGTVEIIPELRQKIARPKKAKKSKKKQKVESQSQLGTLAGDLEEKSSSLREKLTEAEK